MRRLRLDPMFVAFIVIAGVLSLAVPVIPGWIRFVAETSLAEALAALGVMILLRAGLLSLGQGLFYFLGGYSVALLARYAGITDAFIAVFAGALCGGLVAAVLGFFIARYRGIFFSMLTLAISMVPYAIATKVRLFGGSDGLNISLMSFAFYHPRGPEFQTTYFLFSIWTCALCGIIAHVLLRSRMGKIIDVIDENEIRLEYLGSSVRHAIHVAYTAAGVLAGVGGALMGMAARHVDPQFAYWTTAGDFIFIVLLSGQGSVLSPFLGAFALEVLRTLASAFFPDQWQLVFGATMLMIVLFLPSGLSELVVMLARFLKRSANFAPGERPRAPEVAG
jgi:ABC-type branched-subunit amino acid transport system permease subunit